MICINIKVECKGRESWSFGWNITSINLPRTTIEHGFHEGYCLSWMIFPILFLHGEYNENDAQTEESLCLQD